MRDTLAELMSDVTIKFHVDEINPYTNYHINSMDSNDAVELVRQCGQLKSSILKIKQMASK